MSKEYNSALQARVEQFLKEKNISQAKAAPLMGISQTALSQYRRSMYDNGDIAALESKLEEFFRTQEEQEVNTEKALPYRPTQDYIPTSISEDVYKLIRYCQLEKGMVIIHGDAGIGKTKGAERFVRENPTASVYIARAACANPPVLILDEATSSIDTRTEKLIEKGMDRLMAGRTVFVIAHRLSTVRNSKAIMVLEQGSIIERGDHEDLLAQHGRYYQLYTGQAELA